MVHHQGIFEWVKLFVKTTNLSGMLTFDFIVNEADQEFCTGCSLKLNPAFSIFTDDTQVHIFITYAYSVALPDVDTFELNN